MDSKDIQKLIEYPDDGIISKKIMEEENLEITLFSMSKGTKISEHTSTKRGIVYVIEGDGEFILEGKSIVMAPGVLIHLRNNAVHSLNAKENTSFILYLF